MIPLETIAEGVASAKLYYIDLLNVLLVELGKGCKPDTCKLQELQGLIRALTYDINDEVNDDTTQELYVKLLNETDGYSGSYVIDPNVVYPYYPVGSVELSWGNISGTITNQADLVAYITSQIATAVSNSSSFVSIPVQPNLAPNPTPVYTITDTTLIGKVIQWVNRSGSTVYVLGMTATDYPIKQVTFNSGTGTVTFPTEFYDGEYMFVQYKNS